MTSWYKKFASQPHQPFFTNGILFFILFITLFAFAYSNSIKLDTALLTYHAYALVFVVFIQFFLGFLFVVFPKFLMQSEVEPKDYMNQFFLYFISSLGIFLSLIFYSKITILFQIMMLFAQILSFRLLYTIHRKSIMKDKNDTKWILMAFSTGIVSHLIYIVSEFNFSYSYLVSKIAINSGFYLFLFMIIFVISQRMIPFFTRVMVPEYIINKSPKLLDTIFVLLLLKVILFSFENSKLNLLADIPLFIFITKELFRWKMPTLSTPPIVWILHLALYWIVVAFFISIVEGVFAFINPNFYFEKIVVHTLAIGYFVTVLIGFGTRVVLGHSGRKITTGVFAISIFIAVQILVFVRIFASISVNFGLSYIFFIELSAILLIVALIIWSCKYVAILLENDKKPEVVSSNTDTNKKQEIQSKWKA
ncbi:beta-carotene 15,15'-monooxygenase [Aliarcobacter trophiarum LMG 25534]|uniref:Beta-carotene 15,15'-monooxygenase n=1 Tax=Aliarcobacter trophiarum LMG 25534 TaxID=1032241 RepID=A0AAD0VM35_9BACT|nr:NnrS family protein [Aliarcobacter trophiarum]AXK48526.1 putative heme-copper protein NnrS [Aliarcobacter trophiarum LMG 25534]RXI27615.1 beta-carotene 15,15'-monooxygenase [Aliarcobacter trophiarum]RXJ89923.1 beta-carotene 15,15'-monooxygenase [Aliarcobacter trophiarum LMG 25534]